MKFMRLATIMFLWGLILNFILDLLFNAYWPDVKIPTEMAVVLMVSGIVTAIIAMILVEKTK